MMIARHVRKLEGYTPGEQPKSKNVVKLNTNENAYPPSPKCADVLKGFDLDRLRRYCDPDCTALRTELAKLNRTTPDRIFVGNGSDEILALSARAFVENDESIGSLDPSYSLYKTLAAIRDVRWVGAEEGEGERPRRTAEVLSETTKTKGQGEQSCSYSKKTNTSVRLRLDPSPSLFLLTNPNAPTGEFLEPEAVAAFAKKFKGVVLVDEAYADFARANCMALATAEKNRNVIVMRTFSKSYSLAGLRVGYCVGPKALIDALYKIKDSYNVDAIAQAVALAAVKDQKWMRANVERIVAERARLTRELEKRGWDVIPSESNFVFARPPCGRGVPAASGGRGSRSRSTVVGDSVRRGKDSASTGTDASPCRRGILSASIEEDVAASLFNALRERNIFVRYFRGPKTGDRLRVTIGTPTQTNKLLKALDEIASRRGILSTQTDGRRGILSASVNEK